MTELTGGQIGRMSFVPRTGSRFMGGIRVFIIDDHPIVREALRYFLAREPDLEFAGESDGTGDVQALVDAMQPDIVLVDFRLPVTPGDVLAGDLKRAKPHLKVLGISTDTELGSLKMLAAGADGFLNKAEVGQTAATIRAIAASGPG